MTSTSATTKKATTRLICMLLVLLYISCDAFTAVPLSSPSCRAIRPLFAWSADDPATRTKTKRARNKKVKKKKAQGAKSTIQTATSTNMPRGPLSELELADHVSNMYIYGPGGIMSDLARRRQREERDALLTPKTAQQHTSIDASFQAQQQTIQQQQEEQAQLLRDLDRHPALLLNADYQPMSYLPLSLWNWQDAVKAVFSGKVTVVDVYPDVSIRAAHLEVPLPAVIALVEYVPTAAYATTPAFTKRNVFLRDEYKCQYCRRHFATRDLSLDHVVPRCKGGGLHWENAVTCCRACNGRKGSLDLTEIQRAYGMRLLCEPRTPTQYELAATASRMLPRKVHPTWEPYLGKNFVPSSTSSSSSTQQSAAMEEDA